MSDSINRQAAVDVIRKCNVKEVTPAYMLIDKTEAMTELMMLPSAEPNERRGKWLNRRIVYMDVHIATCDQCGKRVVVGNFCPNCKADMRGEQDE